MSITDIQVNCYNIDLYIFGVSTYSGYFLIKNHAYLHVFTVLQ